MTTAPQIDMKLEVALLSVSDVDRAKAFYENLGWRVDIDIAIGDFRGVQITPHNSEASIIFGKGTKLAQPGSATSLLPHQPASLRFRPSGRGTSARDRPRDFRPLLDSRG